MYYKLLNRKNASDYKELDIEQITSIYTSADNTNAVVNTNESVTTNEEIQEIQETEFNTLRDSWEIERKNIVTVIPQPTIEEQNRADIDYIMIMQGL